MAKPFFNRLRSYYENVGKVLRGEADVASVFPNTIDIGASRELIYAEFLKLHAPSKCNVNLGGFLFGDDGSESKQLDIIISTDTAPQYNFHNPEGKGKTFGPVEGCLGVASIKSTLNMEQLIDSLKNIASIPPTKPLGIRINPLLKLEGYDNWPYKIIYATDGLAFRTIMDHISNFYGSNPDIPIYRRPDVLHVAGKYVIFKMQKGLTVINPDETTRPTSEGEYHAFDTNPDIQAITWILNELQQKATTSNHIIYDYREINNQINSMK